MHILFIDEKYVSKVSENFSAHFSICLWDTKVIYFLLHACLAYICTRESHFSLISPFHHRSYKPKLSPSLFSQVILTVFVSIFKVFHSNFFFSMQPNTVSTVQRHRCLLEVRPKPMFVTTTIHPALFEMSIIYFSNVFFTWMDRNKRKKQNDSGKGDESDRDIYQWIKNPLVKFTDNIFIDEFFIVGNLLVILTYPQHFYQWIFDLGNPSIILIYRWILCIIDRFWLSVISTLIVVYTSLFIHWLYESYNTY